MNTTKIPTETQLQKARRRDQLAAHHAGLHTKALGGRKHPTCPACNHNRR